MMNACRIGGWLCALCWLMTTSLSARQLAADSRVYEKTFSISGKSTVVVASAYADVNIKPWDKSEVAIKVDISAQANEMDAVRTILDRIGVEFSGDNKQVKIQSQLDEISSWRSELWQGEVITLIQFADGRKVQLSAFSCTYTIQIPRKAAVQLSSKYGHTRIDDHNGPLDVRMSYGRLDVAQAPQPSNFVLRHTRARMQQLGEAEIETQFGRLIVKKANSIKLRSLHGENRIDAINSLTSEGEYQTLVLGNVGGFSAVERHSSCALRNLEQSGDLELTAGTLEIERLEEGFQSLKIRAEDTHIELHPAPGATYNLAVNAQQTELSLPEQMKIQDDQRDRMGDARQVTATVGSPARGKLEIYANDGSILLE